MADTIARTDIRQLAGIHSLDHFTLEVPDLAEAERFYDAFGLNVRRSDNRLDLMTFGNDHVWGVIRQGMKKRLSHVSFGAYEQDLKIFRERLAANGIELLPPPAGAGGNGMWFRDAVGMLVELRIAAKSSPKEKPIMAGPEGISGARGNVGKAGLVKVKPRRLAHVLFFTPDIEASIAFYRDVMGLKLSDHGEMVAFLHGVHGSDHHLIALAQSSDGIGYHHSSWDVESVEEVGAGAMQMKRAGYDRDGWGLGRHVLGSNYFHYVRDPWNSYAEYSFDIDFVPKDHHWEPGFPAEDDRLYLWGPDVPEDFVKNYEVA